MEFLGAIALVIAGTYVVVRFWRRPERRDYGVSIPELGIKDKDPVFLGAKDTSRALDDAVDIGEVIQGVPIEKTTYWRKPWQR